MTLHELKTKYPDVILDEASRQAIEAGANGLSLWTTWARTGTRRCSAPSPYPAATPATWNPANTGIEP